MPKSVLIDSSIWISYFSSQDESLCANVEGLIRTDQAMISGLILGEVLYGAKSRIEYENLADTFEGIRCLVDSPEVFSRAADYAWQLREKGIKAPLADLTIAAHCVLGGIGLLTRDRHFSMIEEGLALQLRV
jgi:predicted nucleic acid-binding protein